ncbi:MAG TPA: hypothetical protein VER03_02075 [Bryobacteraceae bacterium]|nr:hypothetical protein [Bryobacteraceae bacterium]
MFEASTHPLGVHPRQLTSEKPAGSLIEICTPEIDMDNGGRPNVSLIKDGRIPHP